MQHSQPQNFNHRFLFARFERFLIKTAARLRGHRLCQQKWCQQSNGGSVADVWNPWWLMLLCIYSSCELCKDNSYSVLKSIQFEGCFFSWFAEIVRAMTFVINQGMAMYWGTSRWSAMEIMVSADLLQIWCCQLIAFMLTSDHLAFVVSGSVLGCTPVQPDTTCVWAGRVSLFPEG